MALKPELAAKVKEAVMTYEWKGSPLEGFFAGSGQTGFAPRYACWAAVRIFGWLFVAQHRFKRNNRGTKHALAAIEMKHRG